MALRPLIQKSVFLLFIQIQYDDGEYVKEHKAVDGIATEAQYNYENNNTQDETRINNLDDIILNVLADSGSESECDDDQFDDSDYFN